MDAQEKKQKQLAKELAAFAQSKAKRGERIQFTTGDGAAPFIDVLITCDGADHELAYYCVLKPGHSGKCWSSNKSVEFIRKNK